MDVPPKEEGGVGTENEAPEEVGRGGRSEPQPQESWLGVGKVVET